LPQFQSRAAIDPGRNALIINKADPLFVVLPHA
jgi:hypothetical protein